MKTIEINGSNYRESEPKRPPLSDNEGGYCAQCAFFKDLGGCRQAIESAERVFGGDCAARDIVYVKVAK